jgi:acyl-CoA thioesterase FadM
LDFKGHKMQDTKSENVLCFTAHLVWCFYNNASARSMPIPDEQRALIENYKANCLK